LIVELMGRMKASVSEKEERIGLNDMDRSYQTEEVGVWEDWKDVKPVCVELTVLLGRRLNCEVRERALSERLL